MMIIIFINELKNITLSFLKMNYIKDISDVSIKKYCNDVYCEAETARFNLAKNSYDLLLPNDVFNTRTYYYMVLIAVIILYLKTLFQFIKFNSLYCPYINDLDGDTFINYMKVFPYILSFIVLLLIIGIIIRRYSPNETSGYKYYFNTDNNDIDKYDETNINSILKIISFVLTLLIFSYIICIYFSVIPSNDENIAKKTSDYYYLIFGYLFFVFIFIYFLLNMMNILLTFSVNKYPSLDNIDFKKNIISSHNNIKLKILASDKYSEYDAKNLLKSIYTFKRDNYTSITPDATDGKDKADNKDKFWRAGYKLPYNERTIQYWVLLDDFKSNSIYDTNSNSFGIMVHWNNHDKGDQGTDLEDVHGVLYINIDYDKFIDKADNIKIADLRLCPNFLVFLAPILKTGIASQLKGSVAETSTRYQEQYDGVIKYIKGIGDIHGLPISENTTTYEERYALDKYNINNINLINYIIENFEGFVKGNEVKDNQAKTKYLNYYNKDIFKEDEENKRKNHMNVLLNITIKLCENAIDSWYEQERNDATKIYKEGVYNTEYFETTIYPDFLKQNALVKLINNLINMKYKFNKKWSELIDSADKIYETINYEYIVGDKNPTSATFYNMLRAINTEFNTDYKTHINDYLKVLIATESQSKSKAKFLFPNDYKILRDKIEISENYSVDLSYDTPNTFYEKYYNIVGGDYLSKEYKIGDYYVKNIQGLLKYIVLLFVFSVIILCVIYYNSNGIIENIGGYVMNNYSQFLYNVVIPLFILLIFVIYVYFFICFNTEYNLNIVYGIFDSSYKRSLNNLNNIIIPYIKIHHDATENVTNSDYFDLYIITNVLTSIINGNLELSNYQANTGEYNNNQDPLKIITGDNAKRPMYQSYSDIVSIGKVFKPLGNMETANLAEFNAYYNKVYEKISNNFEKVTGTGGTGGSGGSGATGVTDAEAKSEIVKNPIYKFINNIKYNVEREPLFSYSEIDYTNTDSDACNKTIPELIASIASASGKNANYNNPINMYIYQIISDHYEEIYAIILICKKLFNKNDFNNNVFNYNQEIKKGEYGILKYFNFYNTDEEGIVPYKFILKIDKGDFGKFKEEAGIQIPNIKNLEVEDDNKENIQNIIVNFLVIAAHIKYNYNLIITEPGDKITNIIKSDLLTGRGTYNYINSLNFFHEYKNKKLFSLFSNTSFANANKIAEIDDTFKYTFSSTSPASAIFATSATSATPTVYDKYKSDICTSFKNHHYTYNLLVNNYDISSLNISNNYLKNIIKTIYYQVNNKDILIDNSGEDNIDGATGKSFEIFKEKSTNADPVNTILHKANACVNTSLMSNYIANIILIAIVYNVGYML
jgi:hypothetical protein